MANIVGTSGNDFLNGTPNNDSISGLVGNDTLDGLAGNDTLLGGVGNDAVYGGLGNDVLEGGTGDDYLYGGTGSSSGAGSDTYKFAVGAGVDHINDYDTTVGNTDVVTFAGVASTGVTAVERQGNGLVLKYGTSDQVIVDYYFHSSYPGYKVEQFKFSNGVTWDETAIKARVITVGTTSVDTITGYNDGTNRIYGFDGNDSLTGGALADFINGGNGNDTLNGLAGNDTLVGGKGNDSLVGGSGNDKFIINNGDGWDTIYYGQQGDRIVFNGTTLVGTATYKGNYEYSLLGYKLWQHGYSLEITSPDGKTSMEAQQFFTTSNGVWFDTTNLGITIPGIYQSTGTPKTYTGTEQDDVFNIVGGPNIINGLGGNDTIYVYYYSSTIDGGAGNDHISGSSATDTLNGGIGDDVILSNGGLDTIHGGAGNDLIVSGGGGQKIFGDAGFDTVDYSSSFGVEVNLALTTWQEGGTYSYAYDDILSSIEGVIGSGYADTIIGNSGNNLLIGRGGADTLTGGAGADVFQYNHPTSSGGDIGISPTNLDIITDFANGIDKIDLSDFAGTFAFRGTGAFTGTTHQVNYSKVAGNTFIGLDIDGNKTLDAQIELLGLHNMTASDFVL